MSMKIALVTGASRGIGKSCAIELAKEGYYVIATATSEKGTKSINQYLAESNLSGESFVLDVSDNNSINSLFQHLKESNHLPEVLVNNAGITRDNLLLRMKSEDWQAVINTNLTGVFEMCKLFIKPMFKQRWGRIINISSISGITGNPGQCNYAAAKAGVIGFSKSLAKEVASRNITVNIVAPGFIATDMTDDFTEEQKQNINNSIPMQRMGTAEEIAAMVVMLASEKSSYITGETIQISGGLL